MVTWLRIVVSCFCLVLCVLFSMLWVRSHYQYDYLGYMARLPRNQMVLMAAEGSARFQRQRQVVGSTSEPLWFWSTKPPRTTPLPPPTTGVVNPGLLGFRWYHRTSKDSLSIEAKLPIWFLVLTTGLIACVVRPKPRWQFGMRELFTLSTVGAITIGMLAVLLRTISS